MHLVMNVATLIAVSFLNVLEWLFSGIGVLIILIGITISLSVLLIFINSRRHQSLRAIRKPRNNRSG